MEGENEVDALEELGPGDPLKLDVAVVGGPAQRHRALARYPDVPVLPVHQHLVQSRARLLDRRRSIALPERFFLKTVAHDTR